MAKPKKPVRTWLRRPSRSEGFDLCNYALTSTRWVNGLSFEN